MTMWVWEIETPSDKCLCDTCIYNDDTQCCTADDCFGGDHYDNQLSFISADKEEGAD